MDKTLQKLTEQLFQQVTISEFRNAAGKLLTSDLVATIAAGNYRDELGHALTRYKAYEDLRQYLERA